MKMKELTVLVKVVVVKLMGVLVGRKSRGEEEPDSEEVDGWERWDNSQGAVD